MSKSLKYNNAKCVTYKEVENKLNKSGIDINEFHEAIKKGEISTYIKHPETGKLKKFKVTNLTSDGKVEGFFEPEFN